jgi:O-antigen ligase
MVTNLIVMGAISLVLSGRATILAWLTVIAAVPISIFTVSRGSLLFFAAGSVLVYIFSALRRFSLRKIKIGFVGLLIALTIIPLAVATLRSRSAADQDSSMTARMAYERAAALMLEDHPLGIGPNHFTTMLLTGGYGDRADIDSFNKVGIVHNIYWLTAAEMGYAGVIALVVLFLAPLLSALSGGLRVPRDRRGDVLLGMGVGLLVFCAHSMFEWAWRLTEVSYIYWMVVAIVASLARQLRDHVPGSVGVTGSSLPISDRNPRSAAS